MKTSSIKYLIIINLLFLVKPSFSQNEETDIIVTHKGESISCNITKEDSAKVYFKVGGNMSSIELNMLRQDISTIKYASKKQPSVPAMGQSTVGGQIQRDDYVPINTPTISIKGKMSGPKKPNCLTVFAGAANPLGKFASTKLDTNEIGPGKIGSVVGLTFTHLTKNFLLISLSGIISSNQLNSDPITTKYFLNTDSTWKATKANWRAIGFHVGLGYYFPLSKDASLYMKAHAGYLSLKHPEVTLSIASNNYLTFETVTADAISYGGALGFNYRLFESLGATFEISYLRSDFKYNEILIIGEQPAPPVNKKISRTVRDVKQNYQNLFLSFGVNYWF